jgi:hypothetical protein
MDDPFLMGVLNSPARLDKEVQPLAGWQIILIAIVSDRDASNQFHNEERPASVGRTPIQHLGYVRVIHQGERLALRFKAGNNRPRVHAELNHLHGHSSADWLLLLRQVNHTTPSLADLLEHSVATYALPEDLVHDFLLTRLKTGDGMVTISTLLPDVEETPDA